MYLTMDKQTILLVDDNPNILDATSIHLKKHFKVFKALDGEKALAIMEKHRVDLIMLDIEMPNMNGLELLSKVRYSFGEIPVIIITGRSCKKYAEYCADLRVSGYITKPFNVNELIGKIKTLNNLTTHRLMEIEDDPVIYIHQKVKEALAYIHKHYSGSVKREKLARQLGVSYDYLGELFKKEVGMSLNTYINMFRIEKSKEFLADSDKPVYEIMELAGFNCPQHFFKQFKKYSGITPHEYRTKTKKLTLKFLKANQ